MAIESQTGTGEFQSPGGFIFGLQGWNYAEARPKSITFFLNGTAKVADQYGRSIRGAVVDNKEIRFAVTAPGNDDPPDAVKGLATHAQVIAALAAERIDWRTLAAAGWPQLPYAELAKLGELPPTPLEELRKIKDPVLRKDALRAAKERDELRIKELQVADQE